MYKIKIYLKTMTNILITIMIIIPFMVKTIIFRKDKITKIVYLVIPKIKITVIQMKMIVIVIVIVTKTVVYIILIIMKIIIIMILKKIPVKIIDL